MFNRLIAAIGILSFVLAYLPAGVGWCAAAEPMSCCTGKMCPMLHHHAAATHSDCGMANMSDAPNASRDGATMCSCPGQREVRYVGAMVYVLATPLSQVFTHPFTMMQIATPATAAAPFSEIAPPPPRSIPA